MLDGPEPRAVVHALDALAAQAGIKPGMKLAAAQALAPEVHRFRRDLQEERQQLERLAGWAYQFSSRVSLLPPDALLIEIGASLKLFGGGAALLRRLREGLQALGFSAVIGLGHSPSAARLRARASLVLGTPQARLDRIDKLPVSLGEWPTATLEALAASGIQQFGDLLRLPRANLARRHGQALVDDLDRLLGRLPEPQSWYRPPDEYHAWIELPAPTASSESLAFPLRRLIVDLCATLAGRDAGIEHCALRFALERLRQQEGEHQPEVVHLQMGLVEASRDPEHLLQLVRARLERLQLPRPVLGIHLHVARMPGFKPQAHDLFDVDAGSGNWPSLIERLMARLGHQALLRPIWIADHRPEYASRWLTLDAPAAGSVAAPTRPAALPDASALPPRPLWLLSAPQAIAIDDFALLAGPERIESGWWDEDDVRRDYYLAAVLPEAADRNARGARAWVFQDLRQPQCWYLHGWFG